MNIDFILIIHQNLIRITNVHNDQSLLPKAI